MSFYEPRDDLDLTQGLLSSGEVFLTLTRPGSPPINVNGSFASIYVGAGSGTDLLPIGKLPPHTYTSYFKYNTNISEWFNFSIYFPTLKQRSHKK